MPNIKNIHKILDPEIRQKNLVAIQQYLKGIYWDITKPAMQDPVFLIGCSRSGTTVTYETIEQSSHLISFGYEILQFWDNLYGPLNNEWESEAAFAEHAKPYHRSAAFRYFYQQLGLGRVLDKTCINTLRVEYLYKLFPEAFFIFIHRDGRDNISSLMDGWRQKGLFGLKHFLGEFPCDVQINDGEFNEWNFFLPPGWRRYNQAKLEEVCAFQWISANNLALDALENIPARQRIQLRYEDLFECPVEMFAEVFDTLGIPFDETIRLRCENILKHQTSLVKGPPQRHKWQGTNRNAIERVMDKISPTMDRLGYRI